MKISYSLLASNHLNLVDDLKEKASKFDSIHFDLIDENYVGGLGMSVVTLEQLSEFTDFEIDVHVLMKNPKDLTKRIFNRRINNIFYHIDFLSLEEFKKLNTGYAEKGIAISLNYSLTSLKEFMPYTDSILLLCMEPSLDQKNKYSEPVKRAKQFRKFYPDFVGDLVVDGGVVPSYLPELEELNVNKVVVGGLYIN